MLKLRNNEIFKKAIGQKKEIFKKERKAGKKKLKKEKRFDLAW